MSIDFFGDPGDIISLRNGLPGVLPDQLAVAAELYFTDWDREFARWVATYDQDGGPFNIRLADIPWGPTAEAVAAHSGSC